MRAMSLYESLDSNGEVSLQDLFLNKNIITTLNTLSIEKLSFLICRCGWPKSIDLAERLALQQAKNYFIVVINTEISNIDGVKKDSQ